MGSGYVWHVVIRNHRSYDSDLNDILLYKVALLRSAYHNIFLSEHLRYNQILYFVTFVGLL